MAASIAATSSSAYAATLYTLASDTGQLTSPGSYTITFDAGEGAGLLTADLTGYLSIDGYTSTFVDEFTVTVNNVDIFRGAFNMGGEGASGTVLAPVGATATTTNNGFFAGGHTDLSIPVALIAGANTVRFSYAGTAQGTGDEAWGLRTVTVTGAAAAGNGGGGGVPEPGTWALMIAGFGLAGGALRTRRRAVAA